MSQHHRSTIVGALLVVGVIASPSLAAPDPLAQAEAAYSRVEFGDAERSAKAALARGGYTRTQMTRVYFLLGVAAAADGRDEEAIEAFKRLLSLDPETKLDRGLSPKLQGPMLEARGTPPAALVAEATFNRSRGVLHVTIADQLGMAKTLVVRSRLSANGAFNESRAPATASADIPLAPGAEHVEYSLQLVDDRQNRLFEKGSDGLPEVFQVALAAAPSGTSGRVLPTKWLVTGIIGEVLGVAALAGGIGAYVVGKDAADRWNNDALCLANGMSRNTNCASDRSTAQAAESGAIAAFTIGGVLVAASTILLIAAPRVPREKPSASRTRLYCNSGPGLVGMACGGTF